MSNSAHVPPCRRRRRKRTSSPPPPRARSKRVKKIQPAVEPPAPPAVEPPAPTTTETDYHFKCTATEAGRRDMRTNTGEYFICTYSAPRAQAQGQGEGQWEARNDIGCMVHALDQTQLLELFSQHANNIDHWWRLVLTKLDPKLVKDAVESIGGFTTTSLSAAAAAIVAQGQNAQENQGNAHHNRIDDQ